METVASVWTQSTSATGYRTARMDPVSTVQYIYTYTVQNSSTVQSGRSFHLGLGLHTSSLFLIISKATSLL